MFSSAVSAVRSTTASSRPSTSGNRTASGSSATAQPTSPTSNALVPALQHRPASSASGPRSVETKFNDLDYASQQRIMRAINVLGSSSLLMKYALANEVSIPQARHYFEQVAGGGNPNPIIKKWFPF